MLLALIDYKGNKQEFLQVVKKGTAYNKCKLVVNGEALMLTKWKSFSFLGRFNRNGE